ncbi:putative manganese transporter [Mumia zhuanghuii]|uniref:10TM heavy-metal exporter n=1 Tax=Mumia zhuanghuii TaxID=2585211 RepID=A0A5C4MFA7_9ACTN|nr:putative manganese transporter [Mumia zhuanghuii]TNC42438.1 hypothetical protein FHE65_21195 [Mumia zhuanghuii]TNC43716.1 hypothetical protein FHE65_17955 [Mumia zhuanghuii]
MTEVVLRPLADSFMQVGVFVALLVVPFGWARARWGHRLDDLVQRHRRLGPPVAAALTMPPGCGGAIVVVALYARGGVSYGSAIAALVATMGDASWVLLAADPVLTLQLKLGLLAVGTVTGYAVDLAGIAPARKREPVPVGAPTPSGAAAGGPSRAHVAPLRASQLSRAGLTSLGPYAVAYWMVLAAGVLLALPVTFRVVDPVALGAAVLGGLDPYLVIGVLGWGAGLALVLTGRHRNSGHVGDDCSPSTVRGVLAHSGGEVATITLWVSLAYLAWSVLSSTTGFDGSQLPVLGLTGVVVGALVGLIPGCAVQIVFAGIFVGGGMPLPTFLANTISQDGDALLPLLAMESRSAYLATVLTTLPALLVGGGLLLLG